MKQASHMIQTNSKKPQTNSKGKNQGALPHVSSDSQ